MNLNDVKIPSWDEIFLKYCYVTALRSKDVSTQIGSIIVRDKTVISTGWNGFPRGVDDNIKERYESRELKLLYTCHSEFNAILNCARNGTSTIGAVLYSLGLSCHECTKSIIQSGIKEMVIHQEWMDAAKDFYELKWKKSSEISKLMLNEAGIQIRVVSCKVDSSVLLDGKRINF